MSRLNSVRRIRSDLMTKASLSLLDLAGVKPYQVEKNEE